MKCKFFHDWNPPTETWKHSKALRDQQMIDGGFVHIVTINSNLYADQLYLTAPDNFITTLDPYMRGEWTFLLMHRSPNEQKAHKCPYQYHYTIGCKDSVDAVMVKMLAID